MSIAWTAQRLGVSAVTVMRYREQGLIRGYQFVKGGWWRIEKDSVIAFETKTRRQMEEGN